MIALAQQSNILDFPAVAPQGKSNEWYTPARYIEAAREVMQGIDLDPASCHKANKTVKARRYFTEQENGLNQEWVAYTVWLNPPYGRTEGYGSNIKLFTEKLLYEYQIGHIQQAILLTSGKVDASWFQRLWQYPICFTDHHVRFRRDLQSQNKARSFTEGHMHGTVFVYLGTNEQKFIETFSEFGAVIPANTAVRKHTIATPSLWEVAQ